MTFLECLYYIGSYSIALPFVAAVYSYRNHTAGFRVLMLVFVCSIISDQYSLHLLTQHKHNLWVYNIYTLFEGVILLYVITTWLKKNKEDNALRIGAVMFFIIVWGITTYTTSGIRQYNNLAPLIEGVAIICFSAWFLYHLSNTTKHNLLMHPKFYIASGMLIYFAASVVIFGTLDYIVAKGNSVAGKLYAIHSLFSVICNILYFTGYMLKARRPL